MKGRYQRLQKNGSIVQSDVHLLYCAHFMNIFSHFCEMLKLDIFSVQNALMVSGLLCCAAVIYEGLDGGLVFTIH